jgi:group I intron endonuclease
LKRRLKDYFSENRLKGFLSKSRSLIYQALLKYGYDNFTLEILEYCEHSLLESREQYYINL